MRAHTHRAHHDAVFDSFAKVVRLSDVLYRNGGIRVTKAVLNSFGLPGGHPRKPQLPVADAIVTKVLSDITRIGVALD